MWLLRHIKLLICLNASIRRTQFFMALNSYKISPPAPLWVSGLLGTIAIVPAVLLLIISIAGLSLAGALMCGVIGIALVSSAFAGCAISRMVGHNQNRYAMAAIGGVIAGALTGLPLVGGFISGVAFVFMLGYIIQIIWRNAHLKPQQPVNTPELPTA